MSAFQSVVNSTATAPATTKPSLAKPSHNLSTHPLSEDELGRLVQEHGSKKPIVEEMLFPETVNIGVGTSGLGKSPLFYQLGECIAAEIPFLGMPTAGGEVVYVDFEDGAKQSSELAQTVARHLGLKQVPDGFRLWLPDAGGSLDLEGMLAECQADGRSPVLVIIDPLRLFNARALKGSSEETAAMFGRLGTLAHKYHTSFLIVHHVRKSSRGSGFDDSGPAPLEDAPIMEWLDESAGSRALIEPRLHSHRPRVAKAGE